MFRIKCVSDTRYILYVYIHTHNLSTHYMHRSITSDTTVPRPRVVTLSLVCVGRDLGDGNRGGPYGGLRIPSGGEMPHLYTSLPNLKSVKPSGQKKTVRNGLFRGFLFCRPRRVRPIYMLLFILKVILQTRLHTYSSNNNVNSHGCATR